MRCGRCAGVKVRWWVWAGRGRCPVWVQGGWTLAQCMSLLRCRLLERPTRPPRRNLWGTGDEDALTCQCCKGCHAARGPGGAACCSPARPGARTRATRRSRFCSLTPADQQHHDSMLALASVTNVQTRMGLIHRREVGCGPGKNNMRRTCEQLPNGDSAVWWPDARPQAVAKGAWA